MSGQGIVALLLALFAGLPVLAQSGSVRLSYAGWQLEWAEEFAAPSAADSATLAAHWRFQYPWGRSLGYPESQFYSSKQVQAAPGGLLAFRAKKLTVPRPYQGRELQYESGMLFSHHPNDSLRPNPNSRSSTDGFSYGIFEIRCQLPTSRDAWPAFWLYGGVPDEVDIFEGNLNLIMNTTHVKAHEYWRPDVATVGCSCLFYADGQRVTLSRSFHTYSLRWLPGELTFYFDGIPIRHETRYQMLGLPMDVIANLAMFQWGSVPAQAMLIDYIRIYRPTRAMLARPDVPYRQPQTEAKSDLLRIPWLSSIGAGADPTPRQQWQLAAPAAAPPVLELLENLNPVCSSTYALPQAERWSPPWNVTEGYPLISVAGAARPWRWQLTDYAGRPVASGAVAADSAWQLPVPGPGSYLLRLQMGGHEIHQTLYVIDRAASTRPDPGWLRPPVTGAAQ